MESEAKLPWKQKTFSLYMLILSLFFQFQESCDFYLSETGRNSSDLQQMKCGDENLGTVHVFTEQF